MGILLLGVLCEYIFEAAGVGTHSLLAYVAETQTARLKILIKYTILAVVIMLTCAAGHKILLRKIRKTVRLLNARKKDTKEEDGRKASIESTHTSNGIRGVLARGICELQEEMVGGCRSLIN